MSSRTSVHRSTDPVSEFSARHIGIGSMSRAKMLAEIGYATLDDLVDAAVPGDIRTSTGLRPPEAATEAEATIELRRLSARNTVSVPMIGLGYHPTSTPAVTRRNVLEAPAWYTAYTPYQPKISQGPLEALLNFPTGISAHKYWPPVGRIEQAYGDRNLLFSCSVPDGFES